MINILNFNCDRCGQPIKPEDGMYIVNQDRNALLVCRRLAD